MVFVQCGAIAIELRDLKHRYDEALRGEARLISGLVGEAMVQPLWDYDLAQVGSLAAQTLEDRVIARASVSGPDGQIIAEASQSGYEERPGDLRFTYPLQYNRGEISEPLGELELVLRTDTVTAALTSAVLNKLMLSSAILALIGAALFFVVTRLSRPLVQLSAIIARVGDGELDCEVPWLDRRDDIGQVARALERLRKNEAEVAILRSQNDEETRRERRRIRRALASTQDAILLADERGMIVYRNPNAADLFDGIQVRAPLRFAPWIDDPSAREIDRSVAARQNFLVSAAGPLQEDGHPLSLLIRGGPIQDEDGTFLGTAVLATDHTEQTRQTERVRYLSEHDSLTGLANRRLLESTLADWVSDEGIEASVMLADLDHFKRINDTLGHPVGDALLRRAALLFEAEVGVDELPARLGGDEFAIIARGSDSAERLTKIARALLAALSEPQHIDGRVLHTGLSIGISTIQAGEPNPADGLRRADLALYEAKRQGRGRLELFREALEATVRRKSLIETELRRALVHGDIRAHFQRQTAVDDGRVVGFEALARWEHTRLGRIPPAEFVAVAEETGLIRELTYQIMTQAFRAAADWQAMGFPGRVAVNASPMLFDSDLSEFVQDCLLATGCNPSAAEMEITETVVLAQGNNARETIEELRAMGLTVALDDFGMGYSSLSYLQSFPVDKIKVDRAFVSKLPNSAETRAIVVAIAELGHALGMTVAGEGAETEAHRDCLAECQIDYVQGFIDGPPVDFEKATAIVRAQHTAREERAS